MRIPMMICNSCERNGVAVEDAPRENSNMVVTGRVENGVIVLPAGTTLPEGVEVAVVVPIANSARSAPIARGGKTNQTKQRVQLPLVRCENPGSLHLSNERIAEILEAEDLAHFRNSLVERQPDVSS